MKFVLRNAEQLGYKRICFVNREGDPAVEFYSKFNAFLIGNVSDKKLEELDLYYIEIQCKSQYRYCS